MYCSQCGKKVQENMLFCPFCGSPIVIPDQDEESAPAAPAFSDVGHQAVQAKAAKQAVPAGDFLTEAALEFEPEVQSEDGGFVPLNMEQAMEPSREAREARRENAPQAEISDLLSGQIHAEPVRLDGHSPNLSGAHRSEAARRNVRKSADTFVPQKRFNPNDIFLDSADYRDDEDDEDDYDEDEREPGGFLIRHIRSLVTLGLCAVVVAIIMGWAVSNGGQLSLARAGLAWTPSAYADLAYNAYVNGSYSLAGSYYAQALNRDSDNYNYANSAGVAYYMAQDMSHAEEMGRKAVEIDSSRVEAYQLLLRLYPEAATRPMDIQNILISGYQQTGDASLNVQ